MKVEGPEVYELAFSPTEFEVLREKGTNKFSGLATSNMPKLYIASIDKKPVYVGLTEQSIRTRLRFGWSASGQHGYQGYAWRHGNDKATLSHVDALNRNERDIETVEAEVVFLIRSDLDHMSQCIEIAQNPLGRCHGFDPHCRRPEGSVPAPVANTRQVLSNL